MFLADSLFLKSPKRIMALMMVMTICLLVYAALEYRMRQSMKEKKHFLTRRVNLFKIQLYVGSSNILLAFMLLF